VIFAFGVVSKKRETWGLLHSVLRASAGVHSERRMNSAMGTTIKQLMGDEAEETLGKF
jgi:hypothetical protein